MNNEDIAVLKEQIKTIFKSQERFSLSNEKIDIRLDDLQKGQFEVSLQVKECFTYSNQCSESKEKDIKDNQDDIKQIYLELDKMKQKLYLIYPIFILFLNGLMAYIFQKVLK